MYLRYTHDTATFHQARILWYNIGNISILHGGVTFTNAWSPRYYAILTAARHLRIIFPHPRCAKCRKIRFGLGHKAAPVPTYQKPHLLKRWMVPLATATRSMLKPQQATKVVWSLEFTAFLSITVLVGISLCRQHKLFFVQMK
jgi:hypothetical protein